MMVAVMKELQTRRQQSTLFLGKQTKPRPITPSYQDTLSLHPNNIPTYQDTLSLPPIIATYQHST